jgi:hypothetical protein
MSILLSTTSISYQSYFLATATADLKVHVNLTTQIIMHVYIGSKLHDLTEISKQGPFEIAVMISGVLIATGVFAYLTYRITLIIKRIEQERDGEVLEFDDETLLDFSPFRVEDEDGSDLVPLVDRGGKEEGVVLSLIA